MSRFDERRRFELQREDPPCDTVKKILRRRRPRNSRDGIGVGYRRKKRRGSGNRRQTQEADGAAIKGATAALVKFITTANLERYSGRCGAAGQALSRGRLWRDPRGLDDCRQRASCANTSRRLATGNGGDGSAANAYVRDRRPGGAGQRRGGHAMDYDDTQLSTTPDRTFGLLTHPTVPALAAALAVADGSARRARRFSRRF